MCLQGSVIWLISQTPEGYPGPFQHVCKKGGLKKVLRIRLFVHSFVCSFVRSLIHPFIYAFIYTGFLNNTYYHLKYIICWRKVYISSSTTSRELLPQFSTCSGWRWLEVLALFCKGNQPQLINWEIRSLLLCMNLQRMQTIATDYLKCEQLLLFAFVAADQQQQLIWKRDIFCETQ